VAVLANDRSSSTSSFPFCCSLHAATATRAPAACSPLPPYLLQWWGRKKGGRGTRLEDKGLKKPFKTTLMRLCYCCCGEVGWGWVCGVGFGALKVFEKGVDELAS